MKKLLKNFLLRKGLFHKIQSYNRNGIVWNTIKTELPFFRNVIGPCKLIFDIGANKGYSSLVFATLSEQVVAAEPQPLCIEYLYSLALWKKNIFIEPYALSNAEDIVNFNISTDDSISSASENFINKTKATRFSNHNWNQKIKVKTTSLEKLINKYGVPDFIKIDVEGYENLVLQGLSHPVKKISYEFTPEVIEIAAECINLLQSLSDNYRFNYTLVDNYFQMVLPEFVSADEFIKKYIPLLSKSLFNGDIYAFNIEK